MTEQQLDLEKIFKAVSKELKKNQISLNDADLDNHNHGDNMVNTFKVMTSAVRKTKEQPVSEQLAYAADMLAKKGIGGTSQQYAAGLRQASNEFTGKSGLDLTMILNLVMMLMGGKQAASSQQSSGGGMLGGLLDMFLGGGGQQQQAPSSPGMDWGQLLNAGMQMMGNSQGSQQASSGSQTPAGADMLGQLAQTFLSGSSMREQPRQNESGQIVVNTILNMLRN